MFKKLIYYIQIIIMGVYRIVRDYVIPVIQFLQFIKELMSSEVNKKNAEETLSKKSLSEYLKVAESVIDSLIKAFIQAVKQLLPDLVSDKITYWELILRYVEYLKKQDSAYRSMILFKTASLMIIFWNKEKKIVIAENEADFLVQLTYSSEKFKNA